MTAPVRALYCLDVTRFGHGTPAARVRFLDWVTRKVRATGETAAASLQAGKPGGGIELIGAWSEINGDRAFSLYACHGGWSGGWRGMLELYEGVPDSLFLSPIDNVRLSATTIALIAAQGCPARIDMAPGRYAVLERATVRAGAELDYLAAVHKRQVHTAQAQGYRLAGLYEVGYGDSRTCTLWTGDQPPNPATWPSLRTELLAGPVEVHVLASHPGPAMSAGSPDRPGNW